MRRRRGPACTWMLAGGLGSLLLMASPGELMGASKQVVSAAYVKKVPAALDDSVWHEAPSAEIPMEGKERFAGKKLVVNTKAIYTDDSIYMLFTWPDPTLSVTKGSWQFDGTTWTRLKGDEDRLAILFETTRIDQFATKGCTVACHVPAGQPTKYGLLGTKSEAEKGDLWHWKAARSAPYGYADDTWMTAVTTKTGRKSDKGPGGDVTNETPDKSKPLFMQDPAKRPSAPGFLLKEEAVPIEDYAIFKAGDVVPHRLPVRPEGSRADIKAASR